MFSASFSLDDHAVYPDDSKRNLYECKRYTGDPKDRNCVRRTVAWKSSDLLFVWNDDPAYILARDYTCGLYGFHYCLYSDDRDFICALWNPQCEIAEKQRKVTGGCFL